MNILSFIYIILNWQKWSEKFLNQILLQDSVRTVILEENKLG